MLDGLDECDLEDRAGILEFIGDLLKDANIIIISRKEGDIDQAFRKLGRRAIVKRIQISAKDHSSDVRRYIFDETRRLEISDPILLSKIVDEVGSRAQGMFLYPRLVLNELDQADTDEERFEALQQLPEGIDAVYARSVDKIWHTKPSRKRRLIRLL